MQFRLSHSFQLPPPPASAEALLAAAGRHGAAGNWEAAETVCADLLARQPEHPEALHLRGVIATRRGQHAEACRWLERAAALTPGAARIHYHLGNEVRRVRANRCSQLCADQSHAGDIGGASAVPLH